MSEPGSNLGEAAAPQKLLKRTIFNNLQGKNPPITPRSDSYPEGVMGEVLSFHNIDAGQLGQLNASSLEELKTNVNNFVGFIRTKYGQKNIAGNVNTFRTKCDASFLSKEFDWTPDYKMTEELDEDSVLQPNFATWQSGPRYVYF